VVESYDVAAQYDLVNTNIGHFLFEVKRTILVSLYYIVWLVWFGPTTS